MINFKNKKIIEILILTYPIVISLVVISFYILGMIADDKLFLSMAIQVLGLILLLKSKLRLIKESKLTTFGTAEMNRKEVLLYRCSYLLFLLGTVILLID